MNFNNYLASQRGGGSGVGLPSYNTAPIDTNYSIGR
jgi:hypothetical protein